MCTQESMETLGKVCLPIEAVSAGELKGIQQTGGQIYLPHSPDDKSKLMSINPTSLKWTLHRQVEWN